MADRREDILNGILEFPQQIMDILNPEKNEETSLLINEFWDNIWHNFLREKTSDTITWFTKINNKELFNCLLMHLSKAGWITSHVENNYAFITMNESKLLKWVTKEELTNVKFRYKFIKYRLQDSASTICDIVQVNGKHQKTGLVRKGFMKAGNSIFKYDTKYLSKYKDQIAMNIMKGLTASTKDITYQEVNLELLNYYSVDGTEYTLGNCYIDSRGRSIFQCSKKVFNPVSCKDARALLICEGEELTQSGFQVVYAAIAELLGYRGKDYADKVNYGQSAYIMRELPDFETMCTFSNYEDLHILIWLERIYENLDEYEDNGHKWYVPIEIDAMASLIQFMGVLTNDHDYMRKTNLINSPNGFEDIWTVDYVSRTHVKKAMTPRLYGSGKHTRQLWDSNHLEYNQQQLNKIEEDITTGIYSNANAFKNFIINNVKPQTTMQVNVNGEIFTIECNRFKWEETTQINYFVYTSSQGILKKVIRTVNLIPDPNQFKRYFVTLLLHNLDSQVCNRICEYVDWVLPNHDSFTIHPNDASNVREIYTSFMYNIWTKRRRILKDYFESIGIDQEYPDKVNEPHDPILEFSPYCLK